MRCKMNTIKNGFIQTNTKSVPCPLQQLQVHSFFPLSMSLVSLAAVVFLFCLSQILSSRDPLPHASERHEWPERREESRRETIYCCLVRKRTERRDREKDREKERERRCSSGWMKPSTLQPPPQRAERTICTARGVMGGWGGVQRGPALTNLIHKH